MHKTVKSKIRANGSPALQSSSVEDGKISPAVTTVFSTRAETRESILFVGGKRLWTDRQSHSLPCDQGLMDGVYL